MRSRARNAPSRSGSSMQNNSSRRRRPTSATAAHGPSIRRRGTWVLGSNGAKCGAPHFVHLLLKPQYFEVRLNLSRANLIRAKLSGARPMIATALHSCRSDFHHGVGRSPDRSQDKHPDPDYRQKTFLGTSDTISNPLVAPSRPRRKQRHSGLVSRRSGLTHEVECPQDKLPGSD